MSVIGKIMNYIINIIMDAALLIKGLQEKLYLKIRRELGMEKKKQIKEKQLPQQTLISLEELASTVADLVIEIRVLETRVQRLCEFRDAVGHVPIYETGGKQ